MLVFYLALIVIFLGILFFVYSIKAESGSNDNFPKLKNQDLDLYEVNSNFSNNLEDPYGSNDSVLNTYAVDPEPRSASVTNVDADAGVSQETIPVARGLKFNATIYEDTNQSVRFGREPVSDNMFSGLKRIGAGEFSVFDNSFDLKIEAKYFRFDFHHIKKIDGYDNSILLYIDYNKFPYLIISDSFDFSGEVIKKYKGV